MSTVAWDAVSWVFMWALAGAIFAGCKWLTWWEAETPRARGDRWRSLAYLLLWPGMDAAAFLTGSGTAPSRREWQWAGAKTLCGGAVLWGVVRLLPPERWLLAGWIGMVGLVFLLHFGAFHLLSLTWRKAGCAAEPLMRSPLAARSLSEFWSTRWNRGFNDLAHRHIARPLQARLGIAGATMATFLASGLVHEAVISLPAHGGYGGPTMYFLLQGAGVLLERSRVGKAAGLRRGFPGRLFALTVAAAPAYWLFHPPFVGRVIIPFLEAIGAR